MSSSSSSPRPNLDFYRKQAKQLMRDVRAGEGRALERIRPQLRHIVSLADAQLVVAREQGFQSWASFQEGVVREASQHDSPSTALEQLAEMLAGDAFVAPRKACESLLRCSFCLKDSHEVAKLIRGSQGYICDVCTASAAEILQKHAS